MNKYKLVGAKTASAIGLALVAVPSTAMAQATSGGVAATVAALTAGYSDLTVIVIAGITAACTLAAIVMGGMWVRGLLAGRSR